MRAACCRFGIGQPEQETGIRLAPVRRAEAAPTKRLSSSQINEALVDRLGGHPDDSLELSQRFTRAWELGAWSIALERNRNATSTESEVGSLTYATPSEWWVDFRADVDAGLCFETQITHPAQMLFAIDLDQARIRQFDQGTQLSLHPLAEETDRRRRQQIEEFRKNGPHVEIVEMPDTAHYLFVHRPSAVIAAMRQFLLSRP